MSISDAWKGNSQIVHFSIESTFCPSKQPAKLAAREQLLLPLWSWL
jgi:hypothetical protein